MSKAEPKFWFTTKTGKHIPVYEGESKAEALKRALGSDKSSQMSSAKSVSSEKSSKKVDNKQTKTAQPVKKAEPEPKKVKTESESKKQKQIDDAKQRAEKLNKEQAYQTSLRQGNKVDIKDNHLVFKGKEVPKLNTARAMGELEEKGTNSLRDYLDADGNLSPERLAVHRAIVEKYFGNHRPYAPGQEHKALFTGGGGASGKGTLFTRDIGKVYSSDDNPVIVDADRIKEMLNEYDYNHKREDVSAKLSDFTTGWYHEESSALAKQIYKMALDNDYPVMYDGTATGGKYYDTVVKLAKDAGYKTEMNFLFSDWPTVRNNSMIRYLNSDRLVPLGRQLAAHSEAYDAVMRLNDQFDKFTLWDNRSVGMNPKTGRYIFNQQKVAENTLGGKLKILDGGQKAWEFFQNARQEFAHTPEKKIEFAKIQKSVESFKARKSKTDPAYAGYAAIKVNKGRKWLKDIGNNVFDDNRKR